jgi:NADH:ubiquinone oxidoreductase subunit 6 (subunit J)
MINPDRRHARFVFPIAMLAISTLFIVARNPSTNGIFTYPYYVIALLAITALLIATVQLKILPWFQKGDTFVGSMAFLVMIIMMMLPVSIVFSMSAPAPSTDAERSQRRNELANFYLVNQGFIFYAFILGVILLFLHTSLDRLRKTSIGCASLIRELDSIIDKQSCYVPKLDPTIFKFTETPDVCIPPAESIEGKNRQGENLAAAELGTILNKLIDAVRNIHPWTHFVSYCALSIPFWGFLVWFA